MKKLPEVHFKEDFVSPLKIQALSFDHLKNVLNAPLNHDPTKSHQIKFNAILLITGGKNGVHNIDFVDHQYEKGNVILIAKDQIHSFIDLPDSNEGYMLLFTEELFLEIGATYPFLINHLYNNQLYSPILNVENEKVNELEFLVNKIIKEEKNRQKSVWVEVTKSYLKILLLEIFSLREIMNNNIEKSPHLEEFIEFQLVLRENIYKERKVKFYAQKLNCTPKRLNIITQSVVHLSAKDFILSSVILEAKRFLKCSELSSKEVAYKLGFDEPTNFTKFFKKHTKLLPSEFAQTY